MALSSLAVTVVGCGGSSPTYDAGAVRDCLSKKGLPVANDRKNPFAPTSRDLVIKFPHGNVLLAFAPSQDVAGKVEDQVRSIAEANGAPKGAKDVVRRKGNLVYWVNAPVFPAGLTKLVDDCL